MTDLLDLLVGARNRWDTVRLTARRWQDTAVMRAAVELRASRRRALGHGAVVGVRSHGQATSETVTRLWADPRHHRNRRETDTGHSVVVGVVVGVGNGGGPRPHVQEVTAIASDEALDDDLFRIP